MKKTLLTLITGLTIAYSSLAQTSDPTIAGGLKEIWSAAKTAGIFQATNYSVEPYLTYAPKSPQQFGGGLFAVYNVNNYVGAGMGVDWLGQFSLVSANVSLKMPIQLADYTPKSWTLLKDVTVIPFVLQGVGTSLGGTGNNSGGVITVEDAGGYVQFGHLWGGRFNVGACYGQWNNAGPYSGPRYHFFTGINWKF